MPPHLCLPENSTALTKMPILNPSLIVQDTASFAISP